MDPGVGAQEFKLTQQIYAKILPGSDSQSGSLSTEIPEAQFSPG